MSVQVENLEKNMAKLTIEVSAEELEKALQSAYLKQKKNISIPGFRKGKVPRAMIEKMYGAGVFYEDAANALIPQAYSQAAEESKLDKWINEHLGEKAQNFVMSLAAVLGGMLALVLFMVLPTTIVGLLGKVLPLEGVRALLEGVLKIAIFIGYLALVRNMKDIKRMFRYHGAEHKTIACYEAGEELTVENIRRHSRFHPRCGTSFLVLVILISILVSSLLPWSSTGLRIVLKLLTLPVVMGISYELIKLAGRYDNILTRIISAPGLWIQRLTTSEPDDNMIEVAIAAVKPVLPENWEDSLW